MTTTIASVGQYTATLDAIRSLFEAGPTLPLGSLVIHEGKAVFGVLDTPEQVRAWAAAVPGSTVRHRVVPTGVHHQFLAEHRGVSFQFTAIVPTKTEHHAASPLVGAL